MNPWPLVAGILLLLAVGFAGYQHGVKTTADHYEAAIQKGAVEAEKATRQAVEAARLYERGQREAMALAAETATARSRAETEQARKRLTALQRAIQEAADADPTVDAWRNTPIPESIRLLICPDDQDRACGSGAISLPTDSTGTA